MAATVDTVAASISRMAPTYKAEMLIEINTLKEKTYVYLLSVQRLRAPYAVSLLPLSCLQDLVPLTRLIAVQFKTIIAFVH